MVERNGTETCPQCRGIPEHMAVLCGPKGGGDDEMGCRIATQTCEFCGGFGMAEIKIADRYHQGKQLRNVRVKAWLTQRELAGLLKISPMTRLDNSHHCGHFDKTIRK